MASSPSPLTVPARPSRVSASTPSVVLADVISYGYAFAVMLATLAYDLQFVLWQGITLMVLFVLLRAVAREMRRDAEKAALREARRRAHLRAQSPSRWSVEQRDGLGRRIDTGA